MPAVIGTAAGVAQQRQRYNLECMPCTVGFFCGNGTVNDLQQCPPERPLTLIATAQADYQCVCPPGSAFETTLGVSYMVNGADVTRAMQPVSANVTVCSKCLSTELCSPIYTPTSHRILCPPHTTSQIENVTAGGPWPEAWAYISHTNLDDDRYHNVYHGCLCNPGYYRTKYKLESFLRDSADFIYQYRWENGLLEEQTQVAIHACTSALKSASCVKLGLGAYIRYDISVI